MRQSDILYTAEIASLLTEGWIIVPDNNLYGTAVTRLLLERGADRVAITRGSKGYTVVYSDDQIPDRIVKFKEEN